MYRQILTLRNCLSRKNMSIFTQKFDPTTGLTAWEIHDADYDYHQEVARSAFADMLHDHERNEKYYLALKKAIDKRHSEGREAHVLDIGTGTGLLSMMAAKCGADSIIACEAFRPMANCALKIIEENGFGDAIKLVRKRSTEMTVGENCDMPRRANILVTEVFDTELIGEGALSTFRQAHQDLLEKDSLVVPSSGRIWAQLVECDHLQACNKINPLIDPDSGENLMIPPRKVIECHGSAAVHDIQLTQLPRNSFVPLLAAQPIFDFDWTGKEALKFNDCATIQGKAIGTGKANAVFMWWDLTMDFDGEIVLSCAPSWEHPDAKELMKKGISLEETSDKIPWRDHWMQAVYYLPEERKIQIDEPLNLVGIHDEYSFTFSIVEKLPNVKLPVSGLITTGCVCKFHDAYSRTRIGQMNDVKRNEKFVRSLRKRINNDTICLCLSEGSLIGLAAAAMGAKTVYILECGYLSRKSMETFVKSNELESKVIIIDSIDKLSEYEKPNLVFADPHYASSILPWNNLRFWSLAARYDPEIPRIPMAARIRAVAVEFKDLHKIRAPLGVCEGFDLTTFDKIVRYSSELTDNPVEAHPLWEYPSVALGESFDLAHIDLTKKFDQKTKKHFRGEAPFCARGKCNGIAIWLDWHLDQENIVSTGPTCDVVPGQRMSWDYHTRQGVYLMRNIVDIDETQVLYWRIRYNDDETWECHFEFEVNSRDCEIKSEASSRQCDFDTKSR